MKQQAFLLIISIVLLASCQLEQDWTGTPDIRATVELNPETRTSLSVDESGAGTIYWTPSDKIDVFFGATKASYTSQNTSDAISALFKTSDSVSGTEVSSTNIWGLYPSDSYSSCNESSVTTTLPAVQYGVPNTFDDDLFLAIAHSETTNLQFYNVCGGIKFNLAFDDIKKITFRGNNNEDLAGTISVSFVNKLPIATIVDGVKEITLTPKTGTTFTKGADYYFTLLPGTLSAGFTITFTASDGTTGTLNYTDKPVTIKRSVFGRKGNVDVYATFADERQADNVIYYTSSDGQVVIPYASDAFGANIVSNEYVGGRGVITFDGVVTSIGAYAFHNCSGLTSIGIPNSVTIISNFAFQSCSSLTSIEIPVSVKKIFEGAFQASGLTSIRIPATVEAIYGNPFAACLSLASIIVDDSNSVYDSRNNCNAILKTDTGELVSGCMNTVIPDTVTSIGWYAFNWCVGLSSIDIPNSVTSIAQGAFMSCHEMVSVVVPSSVTIIGSLAFVYCSSLSSFTVYSNTPPLIGDSIFDKSNNCPIYVPAKSVDDYKAADGWSEYADRIQPIPDVYEAVDLGLSVKWATFNVGATSPEEYGDYFAWGETDPKSEYSWSSYEYELGTDYNGPFSKYVTDSRYGVVDNKAVLDPEDDAAHVNWRGLWRMPTDEEWKELMDNCSRTWTDNYAGTGESGWIFSSSVTSNSIFLPAAGYKEGRFSDGTGSFGYYWSSSLNMDYPDYVYLISFTSSNVNIRDYYRYRGRSIRPVYGEFIQIESVSLDNASLVLSPEETVQLTAMIAPKNATDKRVHWTSSDKSVATVDANGNVTAVDPGTATIMAYGSSGVSASCTVSVKEKTDFNGYDYVDLGLPSGLKWATMNVGATKPEEYGEYFAWGETEPKTDYYWYKWSNGSNNILNILTKYNTSSSCGTVDNKTVLDPEDDAAHVNWGGSWRIPTDEEWTELRTECTWTWTTQNGVNGRLVTGPNGKSIFLPAAGYRCDTRFIDAGSNGRYWSSSLCTDDPHCASNVFFNSDRVDWNGSGRFYGFSVRPVTE